jgi:hypothetical protein
MPRRNKMVFLNCPKCQISKSYSWTAYIAKFRIPIDDVGFFAALTIQCSRCFGIIDVSVKERRSCKQQMETKS